MFPLSALLARLISIGTLVVEDASGRRQRFEGSAGPTVTMRLHRSDLPWRIFLRPELTVGESYMDGTLSIEEGDILALLNLFAMNIGRQDLSRIGILRPRRWLGFLQQLNRAASAQRNAAHHYDLKTEFFDLFLDPNRQYSCAYYRSADDTLEQAQRQKMEHVARKLRLKPEHRVLDIGCGWGNLARHINAHYGAHVTGITLSTEQLACARQMAEAQSGSPARLEFRLQDYRAVPDRYDRVVSVGMLEHVGRPNYTAYFQKISDMLNEDGVALVHTIGRSDGPGITSPWIAKYIFPGGYIPALSELVPGIERSGLFICGVEALRLHYARTTEAWYWRFRQNREAIRQMYDERFCKMFEFFLAACVGSFVSEGLLVYQIQLAKRQDTVPLTQDYLYRDSIAADPSTS